MRFTKEELKDLRENQGVVKIVNELEDHFKMECEEFWDEIYKKLTPEDRLECLESITEVIECQGEGGDY